MSTDGLILHLMSRHKLTRAKAEYRAKYIVDQQAKRAAEKKAKLETAQLTFGLDGAPTEEPHNDSDDGPYGPVPF